MPAVASAVPAAPREPRIVQRSHGGLDATTMVRPDLQVKPPAESEATRAQEFLKRAEAELSSKGRGEERARIRFECGRLCEAVLGRPDEAVAHYRKALADNSGHVPSTRALRRLLLSRGDYAGAITLFDAQVSATRSGSARAALLYEKGKVLEDRLQQRREAREAFAAALELAPGEPSFLAALARTELGARSWGALDRVYEKYAASVAGDGRHRAALTVERARIAESKDKDLPRAAELYLAALETDPRSDVAIHALKRLHYSHRRFRDLISVLLREAEQVSEPNARAMALYRVGRIELDQLGNVEPGILALEQALTVVKDDRLILEALGRAYERAQNHAAITTVLERLAALSRTDGERIAYLTRGAQLFEDRLNDDASAITWYERALLHDRAHAPALQALTRLYGRAKSWEKLLAIYGGEAEAAQDPERRAAAHARRAEILEKELGKPELALEEHGRALGVVPGFAASFKARVRLFAMAGKHPELVELYERAVDSAADNETKITYLFKIGREQEDALHAPAAALTAYRRILALEPSHVGAIHAAQRAAERGALHRELIEMLEAEAALAKAPRERLMLLHRAGEVAEHDLGDDAVALGIQRRVLELDGSFAPALGSLGRLYYRAGRWEDLVGVYRAELAGTMSAAAKARLEYKVGEIYETRIADDEQAIAAQKRALALDPAHLPARRVLERKLSEKSRFDELAVLLESELSSETEPRAIARAALRLGEVLEHQLAVPERALKAYERALSADPEFRPARDARVRLLTEAKDWKRLVEELGREVETSTEPKLTVAALLRSGEIWQSELGAAQKATECFEAVLERDPGHIDALISLEGLYSERSQWEALARVYATEARVLSEPSARVAALSELSRLEESKGIGDSDGRKSTYFAILQLAPDDLPSLFALERLALEQGDGSLLAHVDAKLSTLAEEPEVKAAHLTRLAETLERAGDPSTLEVWRSAIAADPESISAARGITRMAERSGDPSLLEEASSHEARVTADFEVAARLLVRSAIARAEGAEIDAAVALLQRALELRPDYEPAAVKVSELLVARGAVDPLIAILTNAANAATTPARVSALWIAVADLYADKKRDVPAAVAALHRAQNLVPGHVGTLVKLAELYAADRQWSEAVDRLRQAQGFAKSDDMKVDVQLRLAAILQDELGDTERALASLNAALAIDAGSRVALSRLARLELARGHGDVAAELAARLVRVSPELGQRIEALTLLGDLERGRKQFAAAVQAYEQAVSLAGPRAASGEAFRALLAEQATRSESPSFARYASALARYAEQHREPGADFTALHLELAQVLGDQLGQAEAAARSLESGLASAPSDTALWLAHATRLVAAQRYADAEQSFRRALSLDVFQPVAFRGLGEAWKAQHKAKEAAAATGCVVALGAGNDLERASVASRVSRPAAQMPGTMAPSELTGIEAAAENGASELISVLSDSVGKLFPPELERWGVTARDKITSKSGHPLRALAERVAAVLGVTEFDLYVHRKHTGKVELELTSPVSVLVPASVTGLPEAAAVFALARALSSVARGLAAVERLDASALRLLLAGAARIADPAFGAGTPDDEAFSQQQRRVSKSLPWLGRGAIEDAARAYATGGRVDVAAWALGLRMTSVRTGALLADDVIAAVDVLRRGEGDSAGDGALADGRRYIGDLLGFWVSEPAFALRRRFGPA